LKEALEKREIAALSDYSVVRPEVKYGENSRIDFLLSGDGLRDAWVEVKSVTLSRQVGLAEFPDSVTARGAKHMAELAKMAEAGDRAIVLFLVQRTDCGRMVPAADIDPNYAKALGDAVAAGVEVIALSTYISPKGVKIASEIPFSLSV
jgi:sugar fermentation stimulation protein A